MENYCIQPQETCPNLCIILKAFAVIEDPRRNQAKRHPLLGLLVMAFCTVGMGADSWDDIADLSQIHFDWFTTVVPCGKTAPSSDTIRRVLCALTPSIVQQALDLWLKEKSLQHKNGRHIAFDGKALRSSKGSFNVNAYAPEEGICLGQVDVDSKENEIVALPRLLDLLELEGTICSGDAMYTQKSIAKQIIEKKGDYLLALKSNQPSLMEAVENLFNKRFPSTMTKTEVEKTRGWIETRQIMISHKVKEICEGWENLKAVIRVETKREKIDGSYSQERRYFVSSVLAKEEEYLKLIRNHWGIENGLHRTLDIHFREDACQVREKNGAQNLSLLRKFAGSILHLLSPHRTLKSKMHLMMADPKFRLSFIQSNF